LARGAQHFVKPIGAVYSFDLAVHGVDLEGERLRDFLKRTRHYGGVDFGKWRFAFSWGGVERSGQDEGALTLVDEVFSQNEDADTRAKKMHDQLTHYGVKDILIYGDCADPDGLRELNQAFERLHSPYYVIAVDMKNKNRASGIMRVEGLLNRGAFTVRRGMGKDMLWFQGRNSSSNGRPVRGSRWVWEATNWHTRNRSKGSGEGRPDDATADGADMMDETRYLVMGGSAVADS
jgi:hypothetical protein